MTLTIAGGHVVDRERVHRADVVIEGGTIRRVGITTEADGAVLDAAGRLVARGFIDLQLNGAYGHDLTADPSALWDVAAALPRHGVAAFLPTIVSAPLDTYERALAVLAAGPPAHWRGARPLGWHFEGPMLNPARRGAHARRHLRLPDPDLYGSWSRSGGVRLVTLAPELPGAITAIRRLDEAGIVVAAGHTEASTDEFARAVDAGVTYLTHLFNAMAPLAHREPGPVGCVLAGGPVRAGLIADGIHVDPIAVQAAWRALRPDRLNVVTDATAALGMPAGRHRLGRTELTVDATGVRTLDGTLAGSNLALDQAVRNLARFTGCGPQEAIATVTTNAAAILHLDVAMAPGAAADLVVLTPELEVVATIVAGAILYDRAGGSG